MDLQDMLEFLMLIHDKVQLLMPKIAVNEPLVEINMLIQAKIYELEAELKS